jgi:hypothetical protein
MPGTMLAGFRRLRLGSARHQPDSLGQPSAPPVRLAERPVDEVQLSLGALRITAEGYLSAELPRRETSTYAGVASAGAVIACSRISRARLSRSARSGVSASSSL